MKPTRALQLIGILVTLAGMSLAQVIPGTPTFGSFGGGTDVINLGSLNSELNIAVRHKAGRGTDFDRSITYNSSVWYPVGSSGHQSWQLVASDTLPGWQGLGTGAPGYIGWSTSYSSTPCGLNNDNYYQIWTYSGFYYQDAHGGARHNFSSIWWEYIYT